jgi:hypothetical protein
MSADGRSPFDELGEPELWNPKTYWVLVNLDPVERRACVQKLLDPWVTWLVRTYRLRMTIPACWYRHPDITERLKNLLIAWIRTFGTDTSDQPLAYVAFDDALERELRRITPPPACLDGEHTDPPTDWATTAGLDDWLTTADWATAAATHPAPALTTAHPARETQETSEHQEATGHQMDTANPYDGAGPGAMVITRSDGDALVARGEARALRDYAIHYDGTWWLGDPRTYVRVTDETLNSALDDKARRLALADHAVSGTSGEPSEDTDLPPSEDPSEPGKAGS